MAQQALGQGLKANQTWQQFASLHGPTALLRQQPPQGYGTSHPGLPAPPGANDVCNPSSGLTAVGRSHGWHLRSRGVKGLVNAPQGLKGPGGKSCSPGASGQMLHYRPPGC